MKDYQYDEIIHRLIEIERQISERPHPPGHFWILLLLIIIASRVGAC